MKLSEFKNPLNGQKENLFSIDTWKSGIIGVMFALATVIIGQNLFGKVAGRTGLDANIDPFIKEPQRQKETNAVTILK